MVIAARRAYRDLIRWMKAARPSGLRPWRLARRLFWTSILSATILVGSIGLVRPERFGSRNTRAGSPEWWALGLLVAAACLFVVLRRRGLVTAVDRLLEPLRRPLEELPSFEPAVNALDSCPAPLRSRFLLGWVWGPAAGLVAGAFFAASAVYFVVDAILARLVVGWQQPLLAGTNAALGLVISRLAATRLATWRLAFSVNRWVNGGYA